MHVIFKGYERLFVWLQLIKFNVLSDQVAQSCLTRGLCMCDLNVLQNNLILLFVVLHLVALTSLLNIFFPFWRNLHLSRPSDTRLRTRLRLRSWSIFIVQLYIKMIKYRQHLIHSPRRTQNCSFFMENFHREAHPKMHNREITFDQIRQPRKKKEKTKKSNTCCLEIH